MRTSFLPVSVVALASCIAPSTPDVPRLGELPDPAWTFEGQSIDASACAIGMDVVVADSSRVVRLDATHGTPLWMTDTALKVHHLAVSNDVVAACGVSKDPSPSAPQTSALRGDDGSKQWVTDARVVRAPAWADDEIVVAALRTDDWTTLEWRSVRDGTLRRDQAHRGALRSELFRCGPVIVFATSDRRLFAIDAKTGAQRWTHPIGDAWVKFAASGDTLFVSVNDRSAERCELRRYDAITGVESWSRERDWFDAAQVVGDVLYGVGSSGVWARSIESGLPLWTHHVPSGFDAGLVVLDDVVFLASRAETIGSQGSSELRHCATLSVFAAADGSLLRRSTLEGIAALAPPVLVGSKIVLGLGFPEARFVAYEVASLR
jgi:outer membrane protein assembly factor BamB